MTHDLGIQLTRGEPLMFLIFLLLLAAFIAASLVVLYVAYPHRGQEMPRAPWLGEALSKTVTAMTVLDQDDADRLARPRS